jgi:hypothetical protein
MLARDLGGIHSQTGRFGTPDAKRKLLDGHAARLTATVGIKL